MCIHLWGLPCSINVCFLGGSFDLTPLTFFQSNHRRQRRQINAVPTMVSCRHWNMEGGSGKIGGAQFVNDCLANLGFFVPDIPERPLEKFWRGFVHVTQITESYTPES